MGRVRNSIVQYLYEGEGHMFQVVLGLKTNHPMERGTPKIAIIEHSKTRGSIQGSSYTGPGLRMVLNSYVVEIFQVSPPRMARGIKRS